MTAHLAEPSIDGFLARRDSGIANARVFSEDAFVANGADVYAVAIALKKQPVACSNAEDAAHFDGDGDLAFAGDFGLLLHGELRFLTLS